MFANRRQLSNVQVPSQELEDDCQNSICTSAEEIAAIDLGSVEEIEMVVVRSANEAEVQVLVSQDGESWQAYGDAARGEFFLKEDASARFVGVEATGPDAQLFLSELSVW